MEREPSREFLRVVEEAANAAARFMGTGDRNRADQVAVEAMRGVMDNVPMRRHHNRIPYLHIKSVDRKVQRRVEAEKIPFATAIEMNMFCEPSQGAVDFLAFRDVLREVDFDGWVTVEKEMYPAPFDKPLPIAKRTRDYLREIGIG